MPEKRDIYRYAECVVCGRVHTERMTDGGRLPPALASLRPASLFVR